MHIGEQRRTIYVEPIEEPQDEPISEPGHEDPFFPDEPVHAPEPQPSR